MRDALGEIESLQLLQVEPFASLATLPAGSVPRLLLNRELVGPFKHSRGRPTDVAMTGDLVESVTELARGAGWAGELRTLCEQESSGEGGTGGSTPASSMDGHPPVSAPELHPPGMPHPPAVPHPPITTQELHPPVPEALVVAFRGLSLDERGSRRKGEERGDGE